MIYNLLQAARFAFRMQQAESIIVLKISGSESIGFSML